MTPRTYNNARRKALETETIGRIIDATIELHARQGGLATTHAEIAELAQVSVATVYKHFPTREALLPHCTGKVSAGGPVADADAILAEADPQRRLGRLVASLHAQYQYFHPWQRWVARDAPHLPVLAAFAEAGRRRDEALILRVLASLAPALDKGRELAICSLLDYASWQRFHSVLADPDRVTHSIEDAVRRLIF